MKIIVLGASGQVGSVVFEGLQKNHQVAGTSRQSSGELIRFDPFEGDWSTLGKADVLVNCVGQIHARGSSSFYRIHVELTKRIIAHRQCIGNPLIIQVSALGASVKHNVEFLRTKGEADELLLQQPNTIIVRPSIVCTHRTMIIRKMLMLANIGKFSFGRVPVPKGFLNTRIQPIMPEDLADLVNKLCGQPQHRIVNAVGPEPISFHEIIAILRESRGQKLRLIEISTAFARAMVDIFIDPIFPKIINAQQYQLLFSDNVAATTKAEQILGRPLTSTIQFFKNEFRDAAH